MHREEVNRLAFSLESASLHDLEKPGSALLRSIHRLARLDLYLTLRIWRYHASKALRIGNPPELLAIAAIVAREFEGRKTERRPVPLPESPETIVTLPIADHVYEGKVVGQTPDFFVQKVGKSYVLHQRESLTVDPNSIGDDVKIRYPFKVIGGIGVVNENEPEHSPPSSPGR